MIQFYSLHPNEFKEKLGFFPRNKLHMVQLFLISYEQQGYRHRILPVHHAFFQRLFFHNLFFSQDFFFFIWVLPIKWQMQINNTNNTKQIVR